MNTSARIPLTFQGQKAFAWAEGLHRFCPHKRCRKLKKCKGGPRGTFRKHGKPLCKTDEVAQLIASRIKRLEERTRLLDLEQHMPSPHLNPNVTELKHSEGERHVSRARN